MGEVATSMKDLPLNDAFPPFSATLEEDKEIEFAILQCEP